MSKNDRNKVNDHKEIKNTEPYSFGVGISIVDGNVLSGPDIERVVNTKYTDYEKSDK